jgi:hypothetical protein
MSLRTTITSLHVQRVKELARQKGPSREIARHLGLAESTVHRIRQGRFDELLEGDEDEERRDAAWCPRCRCHVFPPCRMCLLVEQLARRAKVHPPRRTAPLTGGIADSAQRELLTLSVAVLGLPLRTVNTLQGRGIFTLNDLLHRTADDLLRIPNFGRKTLDQVLRGLKRLGFAADAASSSGPAPQAA